MTDKNGMWLGWATFMLFLALMVSPWDQQITLWLNRNEIRWFSAFMDKSLFSREWPGGADLAKLYMMGCVILYFGSWLPLRQNRLARFRPELGFILFSSCFTAVYIVHSLKLTVGRARPHVVLGQGVPFSHWFEPGPFNLLDGFFRGSFPSGHTATVAVFLTLAYIYAFNKRRERRRTGWYIALGAVAFSLLMMTARCMNSSHFLTDGLAVLAINWLLIHAFYFVVLRIPEQQALVAQHGRVPAMPVCWEFRLCLQSLFVIIGLMAVVIGTRGLVAAMGLAPPALIAGGMVMVYFFGGNFWQCYSRVNLGRPGLGRHSPGGLRDAGQLPLTSQEVA